MTGMTDSGGALDHGSATSAAFAPTGAFAPNGAFALLPESASLHEAARFQEAELSDWFALLKPRVMSLVVFTGLIGLLVAPGHLHPVLAFTAVLCIAVGAGACGAINMWYDRDIDALMRRTRNRPIPAGRIAPGEALGFGITLAVASVLVMGLAVNTTAATVLALSIGFYVFVYTMWLKRRTPQNIVIGGAAGAAPPVLGWVAVTNHVDPQALLLFLIIFAWTPPHFWALAIARRHDYAKADIPMLPVTHGVEFTRLHVLLYTVLLCVITLLPYMTGMSGLIYLAAAVLLNGRFLWHAIALKFAPRDEQPMRMFRFSITYLMWLFLALLLDHYLPTTLS